MNGYAYWTSTKARERLWRISALGLRDNPDTLAILCPSLTFYLYAVHRKVNLRQIDGGINSRENKNRAGYHWHSNEYRNMQIGLKIRVYLLLKKLMITGPRITFCVILHKRRGIHSKNGHFVCKCMHVECRQKGVWIDLESLEVTSFRWCSYLQATEFWECQFFHSFLLHQSTRKCFELPRLKTAFLSVS